MKKLFSLLLATIMLFSLVSCGGNTDTTTEPTGSTVPTEATTASSDVSTTTDPQTTTETPVQTTETTGSVTVPSYVVYPTATSKTPFDDKNIILSFAAISDVHITGNEETEKKFRSALAQLKAYAAIDDADGLDAVCIAGDIADTAKTSQVELFAKIVKEADVGTNVLLTTGNHDGNLTLTDYKNAMGNEYFAADIDYSDFSHGSRHCVVNGYHFIFVQPQEYGNNCPYYSETIEWLDKTLAQITAEDPNAYIFVFTHPMLKDTCYGSQLGTYWYTTYLTDTLSKYPQVVTFGGHLHFPINDERSIMQTTFTSLGCGSVRYLAIESGYSNASGTVPFDAYDVSSGLLVQIDTNGNLRITRMDFSNGSTFKTAWELSSPLAANAHLSQYSAARENSNTAPVLSSDIKIEVTTDDLSGISSATITFKAGTDDDLIHHYVVKLLDKKTGQIITSSKYLSDFYRHPQAEDMADTITYTLENIAMNSEYSIEIMAVDSWDAVSNTISASFEIGRVSDLDSSLPEAYADLEFVNGELIDEKDKLNVNLIGASVTMETLTFASRTSTVSSLSVSAKGQHATVSFKDYSADNISQFYNSEAGFSVEGLYVNRNPSGSQGVICGTQNGGWGIATSSGVPYLYTYIGSSNSNIKSGYVPSQTELSHILATFRYDKNADKTYVCLYVNGSLIASDAKSGAIAISSSAPAAATFCLGADIGSSGIGTDFQMSDFSLTDMKIYACALNYKQADTCYKTACENFGK